MRHIPSRTNPSLHTVFWLGIEGLRHIYIAAETMSHIFDDLPIRPEELEERRKAFYEGGPKRKDPEADRRLAQSYGIAAHILNIVLDGWLAKTFPKNSAPRLPSVVLVF